MKHLPDACAQRLATATGLQVDALPANPMDRMAVVLACLVIELRAGKQIPPAKPLAPADETHLAALLPAAFDRMKGQPWKAGQLTRGLARFDPACRDLVLAISAVGSLGKFLARCGGHEAGGFRLELVERDGNQNVWRIRPVGSKSP